MVGLWNWFRGKGRANAKPVADARPMLPFRIHVRRSPIR